MAVACAEIGFQWFALKVRSRAEKSAEGALQTRGFEAFCPTSPERRKYSDRIKQLHSPLFPGYVFCRLHWNHRLPVLSTSTVEYIVGFGQEPTPVSLAEIKALQLLSRSGAQCQSHAFLQVGQRVRLQSGPLANLEGILVGTRGNHRLVVSVELLQRSVSTEIDTALVRPV
jgi:transcription antitermination factor NusG